MFSSAIIDTTCEDVEDSIYISSGVASIASFVRKTKTLIAFKKTTEYGGIVSAFTRQLVDMVSASYSYLYTGVIPISKYVLTISISLNAQQNTWNSIRKIVEAHSTYFAKAFTFAHGNSGVLDIVKEHKEEPGMLRMLGQMQTDLDLFTNSMLSIISQLTRDDNTLLAVEDFLPSCMRQGPTESSDILSTYTPGFIDAVAELYPTQIEPNGFFSVSEIPVATGVAKLWGDNVPTIGVEEFAHLAYYILKLRQILNEGRSVGERHSVEHIYECSGISLEGPGKINTEERDMMLRMRCFVPVDLPVHRSAEETLFPLGSLEVRKDILESYEHCTLFPGVLYFLSLGSTFPIAAYHVGIQTIPVEYSLSGIERLLLGLNGGVGDEGASVDGSLKRILLSVPFILDTTIDLDKSSICWLNTRAIPGGIAKTYKKGEMTIEDGESLTPRKDPRTKISSQDRLSHIEKQSDISCIVAIRGNVCGKSLCVRTNACPIPSEFVNALSVLLSEKYTSFVCSASKKTRISCVGGPSGGAFSVYGNKGVPDMWRALVTSFGV